MTAIATPGTHTPTLATYGFNLAFEVCGITLGLSETTVKAGTHTFHTFRVGPKASMAGAMVPPLATELPKSVTIDGVTIHLASDVRTTDYTTKAPIPVEEQRARVAYSGPATLPSFKGEVRQVSVAISVRKDGQWNVKATVNKTGGGSVSPEQRKAQAATRAAANLAALQAFFAG